MNKKILIGLVVLLLGVGAGWYVFGSVQPKEEDSMEKTESSAMPVPGTTGVEEMVVTKASVQYTSGGFVSKELVVKVGTTVTFTNQSEGGMWVASAVHPTHQLLPGFDQLKSVAKGGTYEYQFVKVGTWKYHNHVKVTDTGSVIVTE